MTPEEAQELILRWNAVREDVSENWVNDPESQAAIAQMLSILMVLREAGYNVTDDGEWYHPSETN
jgi:hypothetical protein